MEVDKNFKHFFFLQNSSKDFVLRDFELIL